VGLGRAPPLAAPDPGRLPPWSHRDSLYDAVCDGLGRLARETVVGDGLAPGTQMGPLQNRAQFEPDVLVHFLGVLDRQRALLLEHDAVVMPFLDRLPRLASVPVRSERRAAGADQVVLEYLASRDRQLRDQAGKVVPRSEAVTDEEHLQRGAASNTVGHVVLLFRGGYALW
jgi:hypothetical protein